jgi:flagella basal body P-ring formation protein FlgA
MMIRSFLGLMRRSLMISMGLVIMLHLSPLVITARAATLDPVSLTKTLERDHVRLSDVFPNLAASADKVIGPAPQPGHDMVLNARTLMKLAAAYGVDWRPTTAADQVTIRRDGTLIAGNTIEDFVRAQLSQEWGDDLDFHFSSNPQAMMLPASTNPDLVLRDLKRDETAQTFRVVVAPATRPDQGQTLSGRYDVMVEVPVLTKALMRGATITASDLTTRQMPANAVKGDMVSLGSDLVGMTAQRTLTPDRPIKQSEIDQPLSIRRGDKITLIYRLGVMELAARGRALQDGRPGERVNVVNSDSDKRLQGTVLANNQVMID